MSSGDKGNTGLHDKAESGDIEGVKADVAKGANTTAKNDEGKTAAEVASNAVISAALNAPAPAKDDPVAEAAVEENPNSFVALLRSQTRTGMPLPPLPFSKTTQSA